MNYETNKYLLNEKNCEWEIKETNQFKSLKEADKKFNELMKKEKPEEQHKIITIEEEGEIIRTKIYAKK